MIDLSSPNLYILVEALEAAGTPESTTANHPYMVSETLTAVADSVAIVQVKVTVNGKTEAFTTGEKTLGDEFTAAECAKLVEAIEAFANSNIEDPALYKAEGMDKLNAMVGEALAQKTTNFTINYVPAEF